MLFILFLFLSGSHLFSQEKTQLTKVVIDAGHGGKDPGAVGLRTQEKTIALKIALKLGGMISQGFKDVSVYYTREKDEFIELHQRAAFANKLKADLFISIHCNSNPSRTFSGAETYVMGLRRSEANLAVAKKENASILLEPDHAVNYNGFDPNSDESYIVFSLYQDAFLEQSTDFASIVQEEMKCREGMNDRGVRQAGFLVLYKTTMPSVLVETGFLSNAEEEKFLSSAGGQEYIATAIFKAFKKFKAGMEGTIETGQTGVIAQKTEKPVDSNKKEKIAQRTEMSMAPPEKKEVVFRIQVATSPNEISCNSRKFEGLKEMKVYRHLGLFKYTTGNISSLDLALKLQEEVQKRGFKDAFVVAFQGDERITISQAKKLTGTR